MEYPHRPVLVDEVVASLVSTPNGLFVDSTVGSGGHSEAIGRSLGEGGRLICLDRDSEAVAISRERLSFLGERVIVRRSNFTDLDKVLHSLGIETVHGIFADLGMSSQQLEHSGRGFSFSREERLDMRMDLNDPVTAQDLVAALPLKELEGLLKRYGEEKKAASIARAIVRERGKRAINSSMRLAEIVESVVPRYHLRRHPATRTFQALRIAVNRELENLTGLMDKAPRLLTRGGRLVVISYHSLEDRIVKEKMVQWERGCRCPPRFPQCLCGEKASFRRLQRRGLKASPLEIQENPRARSATLRAAERI